MDNIGGIPSDILSKSFPGVHHGLFRFLFRADPVIRLTRIPGPEKKEIVKPEDVSYSLIVSQSNPVQNVQYIPLESEVKVEIIEPEASREEAHEEILGLDLGERISGPEIKSEFILAQNNIILEEVELKAEVKPEFETRKRLVRPSRKGSNSIDIHKIQIKSESKFPFGFPSIEESPISLQEASISKYSLRQRKVLSYIDTIDVSNSDSDSNLSADSSLEDDSMKVEDSEIEDEDEESKEELSKAVHPKKEGLKLRIKKEPNKGVNALFKSKSSPSNIIQEFTCDICSKSFSSQAKLSQHKNSVHSENPSKCPEKNCGRIFKNPRYLKRHIKELHNTSPIICKHCPTSNQKQFKNKPLLNAHILRSHRELKKYSIKCTETDCDASFRSKSYLERHLEFHRDPEKGAISFSRIGNVPKKTSCPHCDKHISIEHLRHHISRYHNPQRSKNVICESCGKTFFTAYDLRRHTRVYHNPQMEGQVHKCPDCDRQYSKYNQYINHRKMRSCRPSHQCSQCSQKFPLPGQLKEHENTHTKDVKYECEDCGSVFYTKIALRQHSLRHEKKNSNEKVVSCSHCDMTFRKKGTLRDHIYRVHKLESEFNFKCSFPNCSKTFIQEIRLKKHEQEHKTGSNMKYVCSSCGKILKSRKNLKNHEKIHFRKKKS